MEMPEGLYFSERRLWQSCPEARDVLARLARFRAASTEDSDTDVVPGALAQRFKDERNIARTELDAVIETALSAGIPRVVDGWERGANDLVAELVRQIGFLEESAAGWSAAARGHVETIESLTDEYERLLHIMAAALERTQVDDSGEATFILEREVNLDGTKVEQDASKD